MFHFLRRVSSSFLPRPDRPWREDATSNAPTIGRKRRFSITDDNEEDDFGSSKKARTEPLQLDGDSSPKEQEPAGVKSVTQGVKEVDIGDTTDAEAPVQPEGIPLPDSPRSATPQSEHPRETSVETQDDLDADGDPITSALEADPGEKVEETLHSAETEDSETTETTASATEDAVPADSLPSEEESEATEVEA